MKLELRVGNSGFSLSFHVRAHESENMDVMSVVEGKLDIEHL